MSEQVNFNDLKVGVVYNREYTGSNEAYAKINGKETFLVVETIPKLTIRTLFEKFGNVYTDDLRSSLVTITSPKGAFKECIITEPTDESEWFKKSIKFSSLKEAFDSGLIGQDDIENNRFTRSSFTACVELGIKTLFDVEDKTKYPLLQTVYIVWKSWEELRTELKNLGIEFED